MTTQRIYNLIILDASGSMRAIYKEALTGVNETIAQIKQAQEEYPDMRQYLTLVSFSSGERYLNPIFTTTPIVKVGEIRERMYPLLACTALYDAMGTCISELREQITPEDRVLVTVITDGYENASKIWSGTKLKSMIEELRQMGWTFTYIGADQDVEEVAGKMGIRNTLRFKADGKSTMDMFEKLGAGRKAYNSKMWRKVSENMTSLCEEEDFFTSGEDENIKEETVANNRNAQQQEEPKKLSFFERLFGAKGE